MGGEEAPGPEGADTLIEDEADAVAIADGAGTARERGVGHVDTRGLASDRLHHQGEDPARPDTLDGLLEGGEALRRRLLGAAGPEGRGAGILSEQTVIEPQRAGTLRSPLRPRVWKVAPW